MFFFLVFFYFTLLCIGFFTFHVIVASLLVLALYSVLLTTLTVSIMFSIFIKLSSKFIQGLSRGIIILCSSIHFTTKMVNRQNFSSVFLFSIWCAVVLLACHSKEMWKTTFAFLGLHRYTHFQKECEIYSKEVCYVLCNVLHTF